MIKQEIQVRHKDFLFFESKNYPEGFISFRNANRDRFFMVLICGNIYID